MRADLSDIRNRLFEAFQNDHAELGRRLYQLRKCLTSQDCQQAKKLASEILQTSGAHIAFEEHDFYPTLRSHLSAREVERMYEEHHRGLIFLEALSKTDTKAPRNMNSDLAEIDALEHHVADCGRLFGAMGGLSKEKMADLMARLKAWRRVSPSWSDVRYIAHPCDDVIQPRQNG